MQKSLTPGRIFASVALVLPVLSVYLPLSTAVLLPLLAVGMLAFRRYRSATFLAGAGRAVAPLSVLAGVSVLSLAWTIDRGATGGKLPSTLVVFVAGMIIVAAAARLPSEDRRVAGWCLAGGTAIAIVVLVLENLSGGMLMPVARTATNENHFMNQFNRGLTLIAVLLWPATVVASRRHPALGVAFAVVAFAVLWTFQTSAALAAVAIGGLVFLGVRAWPGMATRAIGLTLVVGVMAAPFLLSTLPPPKQVWETLSLPRSAYHRLLMWDFTVDRVFERPLLGHGFNTARSIPGAQTNLDLFEAALPLHPHNGALQWWLELGFPGALAGAGLFLVALEAARRRATDALAEAGAAATVAAAFVVAMLSYGVWQSWWMSALALFAALTVALCGRPPGEPPAPASD